MYSNYILSREVGDRRAAARHLRDIRIAEARIRGEAWRMYREFRWMVNSHRSDIRRIFGIAEENLMAGRFRSAINVFNYLRRQDSLPASAFVGPR